MKQTGLFTVTILLRAPIEDDSSLWDENDVGELINDALTQTLELAEVKRVTVRPELELYEVAYNEDRKTLRTVV
jgi:hypothetical protein